jgi:citrate synthase
MDKVDQRGLMNPRQDDHAAWLEGDEAAELLGVRRETLYAYASRGLVRREPIRGRRAMRYLREDLERLRARSAARAGHGAVAAGALRWGEPILETSISSIEPEGPRYRSHLAVELVARKARAEAVMALLWEAPLASEPASARLEPAFVKRLSALAAPGMRPIDGLALALPALALRDELRHDGARDAEVDRARRLVAHLGALLGLPYGAARVAESAKETGLARIALRAWGSEPRRRAVAAVDAALVLLADHELNASAFASRVAAGTGADLYACFIAALAVASGPRHGGAADRVEALAHDVLRRAESIGVPLERAARDLVAQRSQRGEDIPGFGHQLYPAGDPRCPPLLHAAHGITTTLAGIRAIDALIAVMSHRRQLPTVDCGLVALSFALQLPPGAAAGLFVLGRTAGWVAHVFEQRSQGFLLRPRARYVPGR